MPLWMQIVLAAAALVTAVGVLWQKAVRPGALFISEAEKMIPVVRDLTARLYDPEIVAVLVDIAHQFKPDSGTTLRDVVNRLESAATANSTAISSLVEQGLRAAQAVTAGQEASRLLAQEDRVQIAQLLAKLRSVDLKVDDAAIAAAGVAEDLEASHRRAETRGVEAAPPGDAADKFVCRDDAAES